MFTMSNQVLLLGIIEFRGGITRQGSKTSITKNIQITRHVRSIVGRGYVQYTVFYYMSISRRLAHTVLVFAGSLKNTITNPYRDTILLKV